jgi:hypothetical protein
MVSSRLPVVALDSSEARMPRPRREMCLAFALSSSAKGLSFSVAKPATTTLLQRLRLEVAAAPAANWLRHAMLGLELSEACILRGYLLQKRRG